MGAIFNKETVTRANLSSWLNSQLAAKGWTMISSKVSTDGYVFQSPGEEGDCEYYINVNFDAYSTGATGNEYTGNIWGLLRYTPGTAGAAGTFVSRGTPSYMPVVATLNNFPLNTNIDVYYSINKDRVIFAFSVPLPLGYPYYGKQTCTSIMYMGMPRKDTKPNAGSKVNAGNWLYASFPGKASWCIDSAWWYEPSYSASPSFTGANTTATVLNPFPYKAKLGKVSMTPVQVKNSSYDLGILEDVYSLPGNIDLLDGDLLTVGGDKYRVCICLNNYSGTYPYFAIRIA